jgi:hypothetical protein
MPPVGAFKVGRKRSFHQANCTGELENAERIYVRREESAATLDWTPAALREHTVSYVSTRRVCRVTNPQQLLKIDNTPGSPTEPNTPSNHEDDVEHLQLPDSTQDGGSSQVSQASQVSISQFFDFDSSLVETAVQVQKEPAIEPKRKVAVEAQKGPVVEPPRKKSKVELLRLNLGMGMHKIKTNQVSKRGKDIISTWESTTSSKSSLDTSSSLTLTTSTDSSTSQSISPAKAASKDDFRTYSANLDPGRPITGRPFGSHGFAPVRFPVPDSKVAAAPIRSCMLYGPSSSPTSISPDQLMSPVRPVSNYRTAVSQNIRTIDDDYEDAAKAMEVEQLHRLREQRFEEGGVMSSAVKGDAARGLLGLMTAER